MMLRQRSSRSGAAVAMPAPVVVELDWLARSRGTPERDRRSCSASMLDGSVLVVDLEREDYARVARAHRSSTPTFRSSLVDASVVAIAERLGAGHDRDARPPPLLGRASRSTSTRSRSSPDRGRAPRPYTESRGDLAPRRRSPAPPRVDEGARAERRRPLLRRQEADPRREPEHRLRGGALPEHRRVLGQGHGDVPDPRRHVHARLPLLLRQLGQARARARPARAAAPRAGGGADGPEARRRHLGRPRRRRRPRRRPLRRHDPGAEGEAARTARSRC